MQQWIFYFSIVLYSLPSYPSSSLIVVIFFISLPLPSVCHSTPFPLSSCLDLPVQVCPSASPPSAPFPYISLSLMHIPFHTRYISQIVIQTIDMASSIFLTMLYSSLFYSFTFDSEMAVAQRAAYINIYINTFTKHVTTMLHNVTQCVTMYYSSLHGWGYNII